MSEKAQPELTNEQKQQMEIAWQRECFQNAQKHLAEKGIMPSSVVEKDSRFLAPICAVWKIKAQNGKTYWVITGKVPTDHVEVTAATSARAVLKHFSYKWQLKADAILANSAHDKSQAQFADLLISRAHGLYDIADNDQLWANESS